VAVISEEFPKVMENMFDRSRHDVAEAGPILQFLMTLSPSAVDVEIQSLCLHSEDSEGILYIRAMINMFVNELETRNNFQVLEAYLNRFLCIHSDVLIEKMEGLSDVFKLNSIHSLVSNKFRHILERNVCILKIFAKLPSI